VISPLQGATNSFLAHTTERHNTQELVNTRESDVIDATGVARTLKFEAYTKDVAYIMICTSQAIFSFEMNPRGIARCYTSLSSWDSAFQAR
jgi:hypothetical protein